MIRSILEVQDWIVSHGRATVRRVPDDPDSLVELAPKRPPHDGDFPGSRHLDDNRRIPRPWKDSAG